MDVNWTSLIVAVIALIGSVYTARQSWVRSRRSNPVNDAATVSSIVTSQLERMAEELAEVKAEVEVLENENRQWRRRIELLEREVIRLGGDPALVLS